MRRSPQTIGERKFRGLPIARQHRLLAELARDATRVCSEGENPFERFLIRYGELHSWSSLDTYSPPSWLNETESLEEYVVFHELFGGVVDDADDDRNVAADVTGGIETIPAAPSRSISWQPRFRATVVLDQVRSPYNVGSVLRLIDNFGLEGMVHASSWVRLDHPRLGRAARGCQHWIPVRFETDLPAFLSRSKVPVIGIETGDGSTDLRSWSPPPACLLVVGNETYGIARAIRDCCLELVSIPTFGFKKSMNVHHALALVVQRFISGDSQAL